MRQVPIRPKAPAEKAWDEFRATYSAFRLICWLVDEVDDLTTTEDYFGDLQERFQNALFNTGLRGGKVPLFRADYESEELLEPNEAQELYDQLFHNPDKPEGHARYWGFGAAIIGMRGAVETYFLATGVLGHDEKKALDRALREFLTTRGLTAEENTLRTLADLEQTRHILVHNRGVVNKKYKDRVQGTKLVIGEVRPLDRQVFARFSNAVWSAASIIRERLAAAV